MFNSAFICVLLWLMLFTPFAQSPQFDLLIKRGRVVDGSGRAAYIADVVPPHSPGACCVDQALEEINKIFKMNKMYLVNPVINTSSTARIRPL